MVQDILVLVIIWSAVLYTLYQVVKIFIPSKNNASAKCEVCAGCALKSTHKNIMDLTQFDH